MWNFNLSKDTFTHQHNLPGNLKIFAIVEEMRLL